LYELISGGQEEAFTAGITGNEGKFEKYLPAEQIEIRGIEVSESGVFNGAVLTEEIPRQMLDHKKQGQFSPYLL